MIKRAFILAKQMDEFQSLAHRIRTIVFLATPHRGADLAQLLTKILYVSSGARPFVADLHRNSLATQSINDEFPQHCQNLQLYSFYESLPTNYGVGKSLVVDKDLATLGYANERTAYLNANHREVCKFGSQSDPNYQIVRNALAAAIDNFRSHAVSYKNDINVEQQRLLDGFLGISDAPENDFMDVDALRMRGSCDWLLGKEGFQEWRDSANSQMYWISAKPATGKTILSGKIIRHLKDLNRDLTFYFFDFRGNAKTTISAFLLSMAWQMAHLHSEVLQAVLDICEKDDHLCKADYRTIWRKLFVGGILRLKFLRPQYWVVDALDECKTSAELVPLLLKVTEMCSVRILLTSRDRFQSYRQVVHPKVRVVPDEILVDDTKSDIALFLKANMDQLPLTDEEARQNMVAQILTKSAGCFLWVSLILQELRRVHTSAEIRQVLEDVPSDMNELYSRILESMSRAPYGKVLAKAILTWAVCSVQPLTTHELYHALQIDMKDTIDSIERSIISSCGQLVYVDAQSRVQIVHQTARDFLLNAAGSSEFAIDSKIGHKRLAITCLQYLNGNEMKGPRHRKLSVSNFVKQRCPFVAYACTSFFEHVTHSLSTDDDVLLALAKFFHSSNVLSWIEYIAQYSTLNRLIQAGKAFKSFLQRRSTRLSPIGKEIALLDTWATDLVRLVTKFGKNLLASPSSIFHLIPPFCPPETAPRQQFAASTRGIAVLGLSATAWDDCLSTIIDPQEKFLVLVCSDLYFAVGMSSGKIAIYNAMTCQETQRLEHQEPVRILEFGQRMHILGSAGNKVVRIWDTVSWEQTWRFDISQQCMSLAIMEEEQLLLGAMKDNHLMIWDLAFGTLRDSAVWTQDLEGSNAHAFRRPIAAAFCMELCLLAIVYRGQDILLWNLERDALHETFRKETGAHSPNEKRSVDGGAICLTFSRAPHATFLAAGYSDGDLVLFNTLEGTVIETTLANAQTLACSPDGRTLASGNSSGTIQLFDFETLKVLYRIHSGEYSIKQLAFSEDSLRLLGIRGSQCRVWEPTVLVRQDVEDENSDTVSVSTVPQEVSLESSKDTVLITSLACHTNSEIFFCGKEDGSVYLYEMKSGRERQKLLSHADGVSILSLWFDSESHILISTDSSSRIMIHELSFQQQGWESGEALFDHRAGVAVDQVLNNKGSTRVLVCTANNDVLWSISSGGNTYINSLGWQDRGSYKWGSHPSCDQLILISKNVAHLYDWQTLHRLTSPEGILLEGSILPELAIRSFMPCFNGSCVATMFCDSMKPQSKAKLLLWDISDFSVESKTAAPVPKFRSLAEQIKTLIGQDGSRLVFLHGSSWVCSADAQSTGADEYSRHFFLPADWLSTTTDLMIQVAQKGDIIFVKRDEVAVIKRGLDNVEPASNNVPGKRPSLLGRKEPLLQVPDES